MKYIYSLYDAKTGELAYKGKAGQLVADGVFSRSDDLSRLWAKQHLKLERKDPDNRRSHCADDPDTSQRNTLSSEFYQHFS